MDNFTQERKRYLVTSIESDKKELSKENTLLISYAIVTGISAIGVLYFGNEILDQILYNNNLTLKSKMMLDLKSSGLSFSIAGILLGIRGTIKRIKEIGYISNNIKDSQVNLDSFTQTNKDFIKDERTR